MRIIQDALTFDDVLLVPDHSAVLPRECNLQSRLTREIKLNIPILSAAMDTVTEARLAISLAQEGGIGIIHKSMTIEQQAHEVRMVKKYESGVIKEPITVTPDTRAPLRSLSLNFSSSAGVIDCISAPNQPLPTSPFFNCGKRWAGNGFSIVFI